MKSIRYNGGVLRPFKDGFRAEVNAGYKKHRRVYRGHVSARWATPQRT